MSQQKIYVNRKLAYKKQTLEHNYVIKPCDVGRDLFCLPREVTALEIDYIFQYSIPIPVFFPKFNRNCTTFETD